MGTAATPYDQGSHILGPDGDFQIPKTANSALKGIVNMKDDLTVSAATEALGVTVETFGLGGSYRTVITLTAVVIAMTDATTAGNHGSLLLFTWAAGDIFIIAGRQTVVITADGDAEGDEVIDIAVGSVTTSVANETLASTEEDIINKDDLTLSSSTISGTVLELTGGIVAGNATAGDPAQAWLNIAETAATAEGDHTLSITGSISILWTPLGDY